MFKRRWIIAITAIVFLTAISIFLYMKFSSSNTKASDDVSFIEEKQNPDMSIASVKERIVAIEDVMKSGLTIMPLKNLTEELQQVQSKFLSCSQTQRIHLDTNGDKCFLEIFTIYKALPSDLTNVPNAENPYKIDIYNFTLNRTYQILYDASQNIYLSANEVIESAPDVPEHLKKIAVDIAIHHEKVKKELGEMPELNDAQMAYTKTALNRSSCQRSLHLCVAPTFVKGDKALWSIIDLTDLHLVGLRWTNVGDAGPVRVSERSLQNEIVSSCYCEKENSVQQQGWSLKFNLTSSDGLRIADVTFKGQKILRSAKLVDWHVSYSNSDGFGYSDGIGCPMYSLSAVTAWDAPKILSLMNNGKETGFVIEQVFKSDGWPGACNYNYCQRYEFYSNGNFRISTASLGRGCGNDGIYRPVFRIAFEGKNTFSTFDGKQFSTWKNEQWILQNELTNYTSEGYQAKIVGQQNYFIEPNRGQFGDKGRGDFAFTYITKYKQEEGESDLVTIGPCCNIDYRQGPEKFIEPQAESIMNEELVMWYVPQMHNDNTKGKEYCWAEAKVVNGKYLTTAYPCFSGPMFIPIKK
jgi:hypothetical protein